MRIKEEFDNMSLWHYHSVNNTSPIDFINCVHQHKKTYSLPKDINCPSHFCENCGAEHI